MRYLEAEAVRLAVARLCRRAETMLPAEIAMALECAADAGTVPASLAEEAYAAGLAGRVLCRPAAHWLLWAERGRAVSVNGELPGTLTAGLSHPGTVFVTETGGDRLTLTLLAFPEDCTAVPVTGEAEELPDLLARAAQASLCEPLILAVGRGDDPAQAEAMARRALAVPIDGDGIPVPMSLRGRVLAIPGLGSGRFCAVLPGCRYTRRAETVL